MSSAHHRTSGIRNAVPGFSKNEAGSGELHVILGNENDIAIWIIVMRMPGSHCCRYSYCNLVKSGCQVERANGDNEIELA
jgi:hypothetical protein